MSAKKTKNFAADRDFTADMLPNNRKSQFFSILKNRVPLLFKASLITFLFFIPLIIAASFKTVVVFHFYGSFSEGALTYEELRSYLAYTNFIAALVYVPCFVVASVGLCGLNRITHRLVFGEGILFKEDYILGIRNNALQYAVFSLLFSCIYALLRFVIFYSGESIAATVITFIVVIAFFPYLLTAFVYGNVYTSRGGELIVNVFYSLIKSKFKIVWLTLMIGLPPVLICLFCSGYLFLFLSAVYALLAPIFSLAANSAFAGAFDGLFNYLSHEEIVKKGLYISEKEREIIHETHLRVSEEYKKKRS